MRWDFFSGKMIRKRSGQFEEIALIRSPKDLEDFKKTYGISGDVEKFY